MHREVLRTKEAIMRHLFRKWLGAERESNHYLKQLRAIDFKTYVGMYFKQISSYFINTKSDITERHTTQAYFASK